MRFELADYEWSAIKPMLPNKPRSQSDRDRAAAQYVAKGQNQTSFARNSSRQASTTLAIHTVS
jgi:hypothetical protein